MRKLKLKQKEVKFLKQFTKKGQKSARALIRANILLFLNKNETGDIIAEKLNVNRDTVYNIKRRYLREGMDMALSEKQRSGQPTKYDSKKKADIIAKACTSPPEGRKRWSVRLLTENMRTEKRFETINRESIRIILKKAALNHG